MSLTKLLVSPIRIFQKEVITFLIVRRYDLDSTNDQILYLNIKPNSSVSTLRYKVWHLLDLPDYCDEVIVLKTSDNVEIPLIHLRKGNQPHRPYILEVWPPPKMISSTTTFHNHGPLTLTMGRDECLASPSERCFNDECDMTKSIAALNETYTSTITTELSLPSHQTRSPDNSVLTQAEPKKSDICSCISNSSLIFKVHGKKSKDNFTNVLLKIQNDLTTLSKKLSSLESRIPS